MSVSSYGSLADQMSLKVDETDRLTDVEASDDEDPPFVTLHNRLIAVDLHPRLPSESSESGAGTYRECAGACEGAVAMAAAVDAESLSDSVCDRCRPCRPFDCARSLLGVMMLSAVLTVALGLRAMTASLPHDAIFE